MKLSDLSFADLQALHKHLRDRGADEYGGPRDLGALYMRVDAVIQSKLVDFCESESIPLSYLKPPVC